MKTRFESVVMVMGICAAVLFFANSVNAEVDVYQDLVNSGVPAEVVDDLFSGSADTLGQRAETMLENGTITQKQYDTIYNRVMSLPESQRQHMKAAYDEGAAPKLYEGATGIAHRKLGGDSEEIKGKKEYIHDRGLHKGYEKGVRDHGQGIGKGKGQGAADRDVVKK